MSASRPVVAVTPHIRLAPGDHRLDCVTHALSSYLCACGMLPLVLPLTSDKEILQDALATADGLVLSGGGPASVPRSVTSGRRQMEETLLPLALEAGLPVLGICLGMQRIGTYLGGVRERMPEASKELHTSTAGDGRVTHDVFVRPGTLLQRIVGTTRIPLCVSHHSWEVRSGSIRKGDEVAFADGRTLEAIELTYGGSWVLGVQWHPEYSPTDESQLRIGRAFADACRERRTSGR